MSSHDVYDCQVPPHTLTTPARPWCDVTHLGITMWTERARTKNGRRFKKMMKWHDKLPSQGLTSVEAFGVRRTACYANVWCRPTRHWQAKVPASLTSMKTSRWASLSCSHTPLFNRLFLHKAALVSERKRNWIWGHFSSDGVASSVGYEKDWKWVT